MIVEQGFAAELACAPLYVRAVASRAESAALRHTLGHVAVAVAHVALASKARVEVVPGLQNLGAEMISAPENNELVENFY